MENKKEYRVIRLDKIDNWIIIGEIAIPKMYHLNLTGDKYLETITKAVQDITGDNSITATIEYDSMYEESRLRIKSVAFNDTYDVLTEHYDEGVVLKIKKLQTDYTPKVLRADGKRYHALVKNWNFDYAE